MGLGMGCRPARRGVMMGMLLVGMGVRLRAWFSLGLLARGPLRLVLDRHRLLTLTLRIYLTLMFLEIGLLKWGLLRIFKLFSLH